MTHDIDFDALVGGNMESLSRFIEQMPKVELHIHMEGSIRPEILLRLAERNRRQLPFTDASDFSRLLNFTTFRDFSDAFLASMACLQTPQDFYDVVVDIGQQLSRQHVLYAEISWTPQFYLTRQAPLDHLLQAMNEARKHVKQHMGMDIRWICGLVRNKPRLASLAYDWLLRQSFEQAGIVALGLGGDEQLQKAGVFKELFDRARQEGLRVNPHAGETGNADSIWHTIDTLSPDRIGHGVRAIEDKRLVQFLAETKLMLEICPSSNIRLGIFPSYPQHPVKQLAASGCNFCINSDDPVLFDTSITREYLLSVTECGLSLNELVNSVKAAVHASYLPEEEKTDLHGKIAKWYSDYPPE